MESRAAQALAMSRFTGACEMQCCPYAWADRDETCRFGVVLFSKAHRGSVFTPRHETKACSRLPRSAAPGHTIRVGREKNRPHEAPGR
ncbi:hypothetical protein CCHR01_04959 [Colletotrichum chrysophilum]|uniref:Uncharacterized protein n=1 Tax=Colletotrichum chrysophilum TaxID=1836956 RepID=A0AAD9APW2_9PEZI|nr:hypothetical protein CCHR01_04959 [Colletotrichum chrysophilum]